MRFVRIPKIFLRFILKINAVDNNEKKSRIKISFSCVKIFVLPLKATTLQKEK